MRIQTREDITNMPFKIPGGFEYREVAIDYTYDALYRLTAAEYSTGEVFEYTYDATGNRLTQTVTIDEVPVTTTYTYDAANRLSQVDAQAYTWDNNGNLLSDGQRQYYYDPANRLTALVEGEDTTYYLYKGQGDRIAQVEDGVQTPYLLDLNAGLTQVLNDGTRAYVYGLDLVSQQTGIYEEYPLRDALGSVHQVTDQSSAITGYKSYEPYGSVLASSGETDTPYGFAGEWTDASGLQYLRARMYSPETGQFIQPDTYISDLYKSQGWNRYAYSSNNPINFKDPTGHFPDPPPSPNPDYSIIGQTIQYLVSQGYSVVGDPVSKSIYANGADIVFQKLDEYGKVLETLGVECKAVISNRVDLGTLGRNVKGTTYGGSIERVINSATRFLSSSKDQLRMESEAIIQGQKLNNLRNVLFTTAEVVSVKAKDIFNYVYVIAADGTVKAIKTVQAFSSSTIKMPGLLIPYYVIDPKNSPWYNPKIRD